MKRYTGLALLAACALSIVSSSAMRRVWDTHAAQSNGEENRRALVRNSSASEPQQTGAKKGVAPALQAVREVDVAGLKKLLAREGNRPRPLLVNFWATWCEPCRAEFPDLVKIDEEYRARGLDIIAVSIDDVSEINTTVPGFLKEMRARMPAYLLNTLEPEVAISYVDPQWSGSLPATFLYDAQGKVIFRHIGRIKPDELRAAINKVMNGK